MRKLGVLMAAVALTVSVVGCSTKSNDDVSADSSTTETERSTSTTEDAAGATDSSASSSGDADASDIDKCQSVSLLIGGLTASGAVPDDSELQQKIEDAKQDVPEDLQDDIQTIQDGFENADGIVGWGQFLTSDEYADAAANLQQYLSDNCDVGDLLPN